MPCKLIDRDVFFFETKCLPKIIPQGHDVPLDFAHPSLMQVSSPLCKMVDR